MKRVRLTQLDGKLPNLALMKLAHWHGAQGDDITMTRKASRDLFEGDYDVVYGSSIFKFSRDKIGRFLKEWPQAIVGGTGTNSQQTVEEIFRYNGDYEHYDYSIYPNFTGSIGFTQRGCRLSCKFCVVPTKEGKARSVNTINGIWRGPGMPKNLHLLDNDFFGQPEDQWRARIEEIQAGAFKVCLNQGINVRHLTRDAAEALASVEYRDDSFSQRRIYTAWDNFKDEEIFFRGMDMLQDAGIPASHVMAYMLVGFFKNENWETIRHRFDQMVERGIRPYPMVFDMRQTDPDRYRRLKQFQRWAVTGLYRAVPFEEYDSNKKASHGPDDRQHFFSLGGQSSQHMLSEDQ